MDKSVVIIVLVGQLKTDKILQEELDVPEITVLAGIWSGGIVGPQFFRDSITGESSLKMLEDVVLPKTKNHPCYDGVNVIWQQAGAPIPCGFIVRNFLETNFRLADAQLSIGHDARVILLRIFSM
jgi:hypothetical protein